MILFKFSAVQLFSPYQRAGRLPQPLDSSSAASHLQHSVLLLLCSRDLMMALCRKSSANSARSMEYGLSTASFLVTNAALGHLLFQIVLRVIQNSLSWFNVFECFFFLNPPMVIAICWLLQLPSMQKIL
eukprot:TRINITY_DN2075_c0_g3_i2.p2 TRINITY_DN2075_c0_g3~~TRINITY_DN2075_c0_g3_i2.p2  ORF type:complete len:129 (-),score=9.56 TRINITY_DN2075_c0_g3_i2:2594-2980(-)